MNKLRFTRRFLNFSICCILIFLVQPIFAQDITLNSQAEVDALALLPTAYMMEIFKSQDQM